MGWEAFSREDLDRAGYAIPGEAKHKTVTPYFKWESIFNEPQSRIQGKPIHDLLEVVELRFAANSQYKPVFLVTEMCETNEDTGQVITWAERYKVQYQAFIAGAEQEAEGTPLEELLPYGISQAQLSFCRALNIYSVEALAHITGPAVKRMGLHGNELIPMAQRYLDKRRDGSVQQTEINELRRQLAELQAEKSAGQVALSIEIPVVAPVVSDVYAEWTDSQIKDEIERITQARPRGNPSRATLIGLYEQALNA